MQHVQRAPALVEPRGCALNDRHVSSAVRHARQQALHLQPVGRLLRRLVLAAVRRQVERRAAVPAQSKSCTSPQPIFETLACRSLLAPHHVTGMSSIITCMHACIAAIRGL
jgi:hypothetical protein